MQRFEIADTGSAQSLGQSITQVIKKTFILIFSLIIISIILFSIVVGLSVRLADCSVPPVIQDNVQNLHLLHLSENSSKILDDNGFVILDSAILYNQGDEEILMRLCHPNRACTPFELVEFEHMLEPLAKEGFKLYDIDCGISKHCKSLWLASWREYAPDAILN